MNTGLLHLMLLADDVLLETLNEKDKQLYKSIMGYVTKEYEGLYTAFMLSCIALLKSYTSNQLLKKEIEELKRENRRLEARVL